MSDGEPVSREEATKTAWQVHSVLAEWTRTVDAKASFALAMESAALAGVAAALIPSRRAARIDVLKAVASS